MQKVLMELRALCCIRATTVDESMPPDRKAPNGTSARILKATDRRSSRSSSSIASCSLPWKGRRSPSDATSSADQKRSVMPLARDSVKRMIVPGDTLET